MFFITIAAFLIMTAFTKEGVDFSFYENPLTQENIDCFASNNKSFAIIEIWRHEWGISQYFLDNYQKSRQAGFEFIDAYAFVCNECVGNTPQNICQSINSTLPSDFNGRLWIDVEPCTDCWTISHRANLDFVVNVVNTCATYGFNLGIYSAKYCWGNVTGGGSTQMLTNLPLWYAHYDQVDNFSDFNDYGVSNWTSPYMKQYAGDTTLCGVNGVDLNYMPDSNFITN